MQLTLAMDIDEFVDQLCENNSFEYIHELIIEIDLKCADAGFTEGVIKKMMSSLKRDYRDSPEDYASLLKELV